MNERVPEGWILLPLGDVAKIFSGGTPSRSDTSNYIGEIPWVKSGEVNQRKVYFTEEKISDQALKSSSAKWVKNGSVLVAMYGATAGKVARLHIDATINQAIAAVCSGSDEVSNDFLFHEVEFKSGKLLDSVQGSGQPNLSGQLVKELKVSLPPLPEQKKIASILTSVDKVIETTQRQIDKLQDLKKATMNELLTKGIGHTEFKDSELGRIPKSWEVATLGAYFALTSGKSKPTRLLSPKRTKDNSIPVYGGNGVNGYTDSPLLEKPTIVIGRVGEYCGCVALTPQLSWITDNALYVKTILKPYNMQFLFNLLTFTDLSKLRSKGGQPLVSQQPIHDHVVAMPPLEEQEEIASVLSAIDVRTTIQEQKLSQTQSLKKSLMQDLLTGKVRVQVN